ncbi:MAG: BrnT family toxin [Gammaproteobacteria bacterium]|nr:BrnT family toxin [Gammaproteobacteria bacterium]
MQFGWDSNKEARNRAKHGVTFVEACTVFEDPLSSTVPDSDHSEGEARFLTFGVSAEGRPLVVAHTEQDDRIRLISSRPMTRRERQAYETT